VSKGDARWQSRTQEQHFLGIDHTAIVVRDAAAATLAAPATTTIRIPDPDGHTIELRQGS